LLMDARRAFSNLSEPSKREKKREIKKPYEEKKRRRGGESGAGAVG